MVSYSVFQMFSRFADDVGESKLVFVIQLGVGYLRSYIGVFWAEKEITWFHLAPIR